MKIISTTILALSLCFGLSAEPEKKGKKGGSEGRPSREEMLKKFDKDGDGKLSEDEKGELRKVMASRKFSLSVPRIETDTTRTCFSHSPPLNHSNTTI